MTDCRLPSGLAGTASTQVPDCGSWLAGPPGTRQRVILVVPLQEPVALARALLGVGGEGHVVAARPQVREPVAAGLRRGGEGVEVTWVADRDADAAQWMAVPGDAAGDAAPRSVKGDAGLGGSPGYVGVLAVAEQDLMTGTGGDGWSGRDQRGQQARRE